MWQVEHFQWGKNPRREKLYRFSNFTLDDFEKLNFYLKYTSYKSTLKDNFILFYNFCAISAI